MEKSTIRNKVGKRIKQLRAENGITQERFALMSGLNRSYLADIEKGNRNFGIDTLCRIVSAFDISFSEFFNQDELLIDTSSCPKKQKKPD